MAIEQAKNSLTGSKGQRWSPLDSAAGPGGNSPLKNTEGKEGKKKPKPNKAQRGPQTKNVGGTRVSYMTKGRSEKNTDLLEEGKKAYKKAKNWVKSKFD